MCFLSTLQIDTSARSLVDSFMSCDVDFCLIVTSKKMVKRFSHSLGCFIRSQSGGKERPVTHNRQSHCLIKSSRFNVNCSFLLIDSFSHFFYVGFMCGRGWPTRVSPNGKVQATSVVRNIVKNWNNLHR